MRSIHDALRDAWPLLPDPLRGDVQPLFVDEELLATLSTRLLIFTRQGVPPQPPPHFAVECTPPLADSFAFFRDAVASWHDDPASPAIPGLLADALARAGVDRLLVLLGQRRTPGSLTDARALPPPRPVLLAAAAAPNMPGDQLSVAGRALAKHAPRNPEFWGQVTGTAEEKNAAAVAMIGRLRRREEGERRHLRPRVVGVGAQRRVGAVRLSDDDVVEHGFVSGTITTGHGARWSRDGRSFVGFVEPFLDEE